MIYIGALIGLVTGYGACMFTWKPYWTIEEKLRQIENHSPNVEHYAEIHKKVEMLIAYLGVEVTETKPHFHKKTKERQ